MGLLEYIPWKVWITFLIVVLVIMWAFLGGRRDYEIIGLRGISDNLPLCDRPVDPLTQTSRFANYLQMTRSGYHPDIDNPHTKSGNHNNVVSRSPFRSTVHSLEPHHGDRSGSNNPAWLDDRRSLRETRPEPASLREVMARWVGTHEQSSEDVSAASPTRGAVPHRLGSPSDIPGDPPLHGGLSPREAGAPEDILPGRDRIAAEIYENRRTSNMVQSRDRLEDRTSYRSPYPNSRSVISHVSEYEDSNSSLVDRPPSYSEIIAHTSMNPVTVSIGVDERGAIDIDRSKVCPPSIANVSSVVMSGTSMNRNGPNVAETITTNGVNVLVPNSRGKININQVRKVSIGEELTTKALESLLGRQVKSQIRPLFLRNPETGRPLELDCYDPISQIAVEYSGRQHYEFPSSFFTNVDDFYNQIYRDQLKRELCDKNGVYLIVVPYWVDMCKDKKCSTSVDRRIRYDRIYEYLKRQLMFYTDRHGTLPIGAHS
jgi:hypothetical protein